MKKIATLLIPLALTFAFVNSAYATCDMSRLHVVRSEGAPGGDQTLTLRRLLYCPLTISALPPLTSR
jgi:hypothetical protein